MNPHEYKVMFNLEDSHWWYRGLHHLVLRVVAARHRRQGALAILDAGCGTGRLCELLKPFGEISGCDRSDIALDFCQRRGLGNIFQTDLNRADLGEKRYDVITALDVLYHLGIEREEPVLASFFRALKPGGILVVNLMAFEFLRSSHDLAVHTRRRYRRSEVSQLLRESGFTIRLCRYRVCLLFPLAATCRIARRFICQKSRPEDACSDVRPLHPTVNHLLEWVTRMEDLLLEWVSLPFGLSVFAVGEKRLVPQEKGEEQPAARAATAALSACSIEGIAP